MSNHFSDFYNRYSYYNYEHLTVMHGNMLGNKHDHNINPDNWLQNMIEDRMYAFFVALFVIQILVFSHILNNFEY